MTVARILSAKGQDIVSVAPDDSIADAVATLEKYGIGAAVVCDPQGRLVGIFSERDLVRAMAKSGAAALQSPVSRFMTADVMTCTEDDPIQDVFGHMTRGKFRHMPVMAGEKLIGIVSIGDLVKQRLADAEFEAQAMRDYIATG